MLHFKQEISREKIIIALGQLPTLTTVLLSALVVSFIILIAFHGLHFKFGERELYIGGVMRRISRREHDTRIREYLKLRTDEIDKEIINGIEDVVDDICYQVNGKFPELNEHCYFTVEKFTSIIRQVLYKRVRRNNLKIRLVEQSRVKYVARIVNEVSDKYRSMQSIARQMKCGSELYPDFESIEKYVILYVAAFFDEARKSEIEGIKKKIELYNEYENKFLNKEIKQNSVIEPRKKNEKYLEDLTKIAQEKKRSNFLEGKDGNSSSRRLLACLLAVAGLVFLGIGLFLKADWKVLTVVGGLPIVGCLVLLFFTTWSDVAQVVNAIKK